MRISKWLLIGLISAGTAAMAVEPTPEELIKTVENMSIDQLLQLNKIVRDKYSQEYGEMISRFGFNLDFSMLGFKKNGAEDMPFSVGDLNPEPMIGFTLGFYWRCLPPLQVGVEYQGFTGWDSDRNQAGYSDADLAGYMTGLSANYHLLRMDKFGLWLNLTGGYGAFAMDTLNTPAGGKRIAPLPPVLLFRPGRAGRAMARDALVLGLRLRRLPPGRESRPQGGRRKDGVRPGCLGV